MLSLQKWDVYRYVHDGIAIAYFVNQSNLAWPCFFIASIQRYICDHQRFRTLLFNNIIISYIESRLANNQHANERSGIAPGRARIRSLPLRQWGLCVWSREHPIVSQIFLFIYFSSDCAMYKIRVYGGACFPTRRHREYLTSIKYIGGCKRIESDVVS